MRIPKGTFSSIRHALFLKKSSHRPVRTKTDHICLVRFIVVVLMIVRREFLNRKCLASPRLVTADHAKCPSLLQKDTAFVTVTTPYLAVWIKRSFFTSSRLASATFTIMTDIRAFTQFPWKYTKIR